MSKDIVFVSNNIDKIKEVKSLLTPLGFNILSLDDLKLDVNVVENGKTYEENALLKARFLKDKYSRVIADDSGIEIFGLDNQPGIYSSRFLGEKTSYDKKNQIIIDMLSDKTDRGAKFVSVIAYINKGKEKTFKGEVFGEIIEMLKGEKGFGFDPIFMPEGFNVTFGEMSDLEKNKISHRAKSLLKLKEWLQDEEIK